MAESKKTQSYSTQVSGFWNTTHELRDADGLVGRLEFRRNGLGLIASGTYRPEKGEVLVLRRDPGILRSQFSLWTEEREWLGSALRWSFVGREINISTGSKPLRLVPLAGFRRGWRLIAPKSGEIARCTARPFSRGCEIAVHRRIDFEQVLFAYFLSSQLLTESLWPGPAEQNSNSAVAATS
jgi:hypothetical protein